MSEESKAEAVEPTDQAEQPEPKLSIGQRIVREVKGRPFAYIVLAFGLIGGPIIATMIFPQAPPGAAAAGGLAFGVWAALSSVPQKFL